MRRAYQYPHNKEWNNYMLATLRIVIYQAKTFWSLTSMKLTPWLGVPADEMSKLPHQPTVSFFLSSRDNESPSASKGTPLAGGKGREGGRPSGRTKVKPTETHKRLEAMKQSKSCTDRLPYAIYKKKITRPFDYCKMSAFLCVLSPLACSHPFEWTNYTIREVAL